MIVDSSALVAILIDEPGAEVFNDLLISTVGSVVSAAGYLEAGIVLDRHRRGPVSDALDDYLESTALGVAPVTPRQARIARAAYRDFGRGSGHAAKLNFGDCFSYALAIERDEPLLFTGDDFSHTDVRNALG